MGAASRIGAVAGVLSVEGRSLADEQLGRGSTAGQAASPEVTAGFHTATESPVIVKQGGG